MPTAKPNRLLIVDGHAYAYRAYHAIRELTSPDGRATNAIYGFIKMLTKLQAQLEPSHVAVIWDGGLSPERVAEHPEYKAQRPPMPESLGRQIDEMVEYLSAAGVASLCADGVEADDWIGALAGASASVMPVVIASADKDFMQLVGPNVGLVNPNDKSERIWTADDVMVKAGVAPEQIVDWLSLIGDSVDNIPGVPGVGPKTATDLLKQFGNVAGIYARLPEVKSDRLRAALQQAELAVRRNQGLIQLKTDGHRVNLDEVALKACEAERLRQLFTGWGFKGMLADLEKKHFVRETQEVLL